MVWCAGKDCRTFGDLFQIIFSDSVSLLSMHLLIGFSAELWGINREGQTWRLRCKAAHWSEGREQGGWLGSVSNMSLTSADLKKRLVCMKKPKSHLRSCVGSKAQVLQGIRLSVRTVFQNKGSWLLWSQKYLGSKADVSVAEADSELDAHLGTLDYPESVFLQLCKTQRDQPTWWQTLISLGDPQWCQRGGHSELEKKSDTLHCLWKVSNREDTDT